MGFWIGAKDAIGAIRLHGDIKDRDEARRLIKLLKSYSKGLPTQKQLIAEQKKNEEADKFKA